MKQWAVWFALLLLGCGGSPEAQSADDVDESEVEVESPDMGEEGIDDEVASDADEQASGGSDDGGLATPEEIQAVLQLVIDDEALDPYLKLGEPGRFPLKVAGDIPKTIELIKATKPVKFVEGPADDKDAVLEFTEVKISGKTANVRYRYDIEGVRASATLEKVEGRWTLKRSRVTEY